MVPRHMCNSSNLSDCRPYVVLRVPRITTSTRQGNGVVALKYLLRPRSCLLSFLVMMKKGIEFSCVRLSSSTSPRKGVCGSHREEALPCYDLWKHRDFGGG